jgi:chorismate synthase
MTLRFLTSGESHGRGLLLILEGLPSGLFLPREAFEGELRRRRRGFGRGPRMGLEKDRLSFWGGVRNGFTTGAPLGCVLENTEWEAWRDAMDPEQTNPEAVEKVRPQCPRPGHADLSGALKYGTSDVRNVLERASARSTAAWTLAGVAAKLLLEDLGVVLWGSVLSIGSASVPLPGNSQEWEEARNSDMGCPLSGEPALRAPVERALEEGETLGGTFCLRVTGMPPGIGSYVEWDRRLDGLCAGALMALPGIKAVGVGDGEELGRDSGSHVHDPIEPLPEGGYRRSRNRAGGIEGGVTNGEELLFRATMKPIPTLKKPLPSVNLRSHQPQEAHVERGDACAVPSACVVGETLLAWVLARTIMEQFGGDRMEDLKERFAAHRARMERGLADA